MPGYPLSKSSCTCALQEIARYTPEDRMRVVSFHPSVVFTEAVRAAGYTKDTMPYTDGKDNSWRADGLVVRSR